MMTTSQPATGCQQQAEYRVRYQLGPVTVELSTDEPAVGDYLGEFYPAATAVSGKPDWIVDARVGPGGEMRRNAYGVACAADTGVRTLVVRAGDSVSLAMTTRKAVRDTLVAFCETRRATMLHASAIADHRRVIIIAGDKGSGKTTLALRGALVHGMRYLSNDHLIVYPSGAAGSSLSSQLVLTSLPTPIPVKVGTYLDLEQILPEPWDAEGTDIARYREMPAHERYRHDARLLYTYRRLGQDNPVILPLGSSRAESRVLVVLARYAADAGPAGDPVPVRDPAGALMEHVRFDWVFDSVLNYQYVPRRARDRAAYAADARRIAEALAARADVVSWVHAGDPAPLLDLLGGQS
jgi:hypothetical protein